MPTIRVEMPPKVERWRHDRYRPWLARALFDEVCAYCLTPSGGTEIDHVRPRAFAPSDVDEPANLLMACSGCNRAKSDYHPEHVARRHLRHDRSGHRCLDVRVDDLAALYAVGRDGALSARPGATEDFAIWNATALLALDGPRLNRERQEMLDLVEVFEECLSRRDEEPGIERHLTVLVEALARRWPFVEAFGLPVSPEGRSMVMTRRAAALPPLPPLPPQP